MEKCEIENYIIYDKQVLIDWVKAQAAQDVGDIFISDWIAKLEETITDIEAAFNTLGKGSPWSPDVKVSTDFLDLLFNTFYEKTQDT